MTQRALGHAVAAGLLVLALAACADALPAAPSSAPASPGGSAAVAPTQPVASPGSSPEPSAPATATATPTTATPGPAFPQDFMPDGAWSVEFWTPGQGRVTEYYYLTRTCPASTCDVRAVARDQFGAEVSSGVFKRSGDAYQLHVTERKPVACGPSSAVSISATASVTTDLTLAPERGGSSGFVSVGIFGTRNVDFGSTSLCPTRTLDYTATGTKVEIAEIPSEAPGPGAGSAVEPTPVAGGVPPPNVPVQVTGATIMYYPVVGTTATDLLQGMETTATAVCGLIDYSWYSGNPHPVSCAKLAFADNPGITFVTNGATGACTVSVSRVLWTATIPIPRWTAPRTVPAPLATWWKTYVTYVATHEGGHVAIFRQWIGLLPGRLAGQPCSSAQSITDAWNQQEQAAQEAYDRREYAKPQPTPPAAFW